MSKIGRKPVDIPKEVKVKLTEKIVEVEGPKGKLSFKLPEGINVELKGNQVYVSREKDKWKYRALHGLTRSLLKNMVEGTSVGFKKELIVEGVGYKASLQPDKSLALHVGFSHPVLFKPPSGINLEVKGNRIIVEGIDKAEVGRVAAEIRKIRPAGPYKIKGLRYIDEEVRLKPGKTK